MQNATPLTTAPFRRRWLLLTLLLGLSLPGRAQWVLQPFTFNSPEVFAYYFGVVDANVVWAVGYDENGTNRSVALTTNGGQSWTLRPILALATDETLNSITASSASSAWVTTLDGVGGGGRVLHTTDGGLSWVAQPGAAFGSVAPTFVRFFSATNGVAVGDPAAAPGSPFTIFRTTNGGLSWQPATTVPPATAFESGVVLAPAVVGTTLWFGTDEGRVFKTTDQGITWTVATATTVASELYTLAFTDALRGVAFGIDSNDNLILHATTDGGLTWQPRPYTGQPFAAGVTGVPGTDLLVSVGAGDLGPNDVGSSYSRDNGATWVPIETTQQHAGIAAFSGSAVWSGALQVGAMFQTTGLGAYRLPATALAQRVPLAPAAALAYPNPSPDGRFHLPLPAPAATLRLTDALGRPVWQQATPAGQPELLLDAHQAGLRPGLYVLTVAAATGSTRQQLVVE